jgi:hypothetical protein
VRLLSAAFESEKRMMNDINERSQSERSRVVEKLVGSFEPLKRLEFDGFHQFLRLLSLSFTKQETHHAPNCPSEMQKNRD